MGWDTRLFIFYLTACADAGETWFTDQTLYIIQSYSRLILIKKSLALSTILRYLYFTYYNLLLLYTSAPLQANIILHTTNFNLTFMAFGSFANMLQWPYVSSDFFVTFPSSAFYCNVKHAFRKSQSNSTSLLTTKYRCIFDHKLDLES